MTPNRVVAIAAAVVSLALGVLPVIGNFDWTSTAGVIAGIVAVLGIAQKWLEGWQKHEASVVDLTAQTIEAKPRSIVKRRHRLPRPSERPE